MGSEGFDALIDDVTARVEAAIPGAAFKAMEHVREVAVSRTPIETGNLRSEASVIPQPDGADVYYPGPYARRQEYDLEYHHETGQRLYLTSSIQTEAPKVLEILAQEIGKAIE
jgi:hypothetical protein